MKIGHIGAYNRNLGDNIALLNVRKEFDKHIPGIEWTTIDIGDTFWSKENSIEYIKNYFEQWKYDALVVGGGGLVESHGYHFASAYDKGIKSTNYKLPFNKEILEAIKIPVFFAGVGINYFRGKEGFTKEAFESFKETIEYSSVFSLRNDGSINKLKELGTDPSLTWSLEAPKDVDKLIEKIIEIPDPGLIFDKTVRTKTTFFRNFIQPAFNSNEFHNNNRYKSKENIEKLVKFANTNSLLAIPHCHKDFKYFKHFLFGKDFLLNSISFKNTNSLSKIYLDFDSIIAMRGHGQLMSIGRNIPGIYFSTQDKVRDFSLLNGFENYNVDIEEDNWYEKLEDKFQRILKDSSYIKEWYEIREENMPKWRDQFKSFVLECKKHL